MTEITDKTQKTMPKPGPKTPYHLKKDRWEFWQYTFTPNVLLAEKKIKWYDDDKFDEIWSFCRKRYVRFYWDEATDNASKYTRHNTTVELYMKFPDGVSFKEKVEKMEQLIEEIGCL